jgi:hypothetical protein
MVLRAATERVDDTAFRVTLLGKLHKVGPFLLFLAAGPAAGEADLFTDGDPSEQYGQARMLGSIHNNNCIRLTPA